MLQEEKFMSKKLLKVSLLSLLVLPVLSACNQKEYALDVDKFEKKEDIPTYMFNPTEPNYCINLAEYAMEGEESGTSYVFINDSTIPYYSLTDYVYEYLEEYSDKILNLIELNEEIIKYRLNRNHMFFGENGTLCK